MCKVWLAVRVSLLAIPACLGATLPVAAQIDLKLGTIRILGIEKAMPAGRVDEVFRKNADSIIPLPTREQSPIQVYVRQDDSLYRLVDRHWGVQLTAAELSDVESQLLRLPQNATYVERSTSKLILQPGDILYLPRTISGFEKTGPLVVPAASVPDESDLRPKTNSIPPQARRVEPLASSFDYQSCKGETSKIFDEDASTALSFLAKRTVVAKSPITIAVIDTALNGQPGWLMPWLFSMDGKIGLRATGSMKQVGGVFIPDGENGHGSHVVSLILGGKTLADASSVRPEVKILPIVVQNDYVDLNGTWKYQTNATWISNAIRYAKQYDARIVNISFESQAGYDISAAIKESTEADLRLYVVAAGNSRFKLSGDEAIRDYLVAPFSSTDEHVIPAMLGGPSTGHVVSVAAMTTFGTLAESSGRSRKHVDIVGPGECLGGYGEFGPTQALSKELSLTGTSQAAAAVSFASTLLAKSFGYEKFHPAEIKARLLASSVYEANWESVIASSGRLSMARAVALHDDIVSIKILDKTKDLYGTIQFDPKFSICYDKQMPLRRVWKAVRFGVDGGNQTFKFVQRPRMPYRKGIGDAAEFEWDWQECTANFGNLRVLKIKNEEGKIEEIPFDAVREIIPRHL